MGRGQTEIRQGTNAVEIALNKAIDYHNYYPIRNRKVSWIKRYDTPERTKKYINSLVILTQIHHQ